MALPTISLPSFETKIPSTKKKIKFRPFLVKEEKVLLMALEGKDKREIANAIYDVLDDCIITKNVDVRKLPTFDIEYLFLMLRSKSVGEEITFTMSHGEGIECDHKTEVSVNLNEVQVEGKILDGNIMLTDTVGIKMHYPTIDAIDNLKEDTDAILSVLASCIDVVFDDDDVYEDFTHDEMIEWLGNLNTSQFEKINEFFSNSPKLSHTIKWKCPKCGQDDEVTIEGLYNFFI
jgi:hypothetical protein